MRCRVFDVDSAKGVDVYGLRNYDAAVLLGNDAEVREWSGGEA